MHVRPQLGARSYHSRSAVGPARTSVAGDDSPSPQIDTSANDDMVRRQQDQDNLQQMINNQQMINDQQMLNDQMFQQQQQQMINNMNQ
jgi:hypothetical protein